MANQTLKIPNTKVPPDFIFNAIQETTSFDLKLNSKVYWSGVEPSITYFTKSKKGISWEMIEFQFHTKTSFEIIQFEKKIGEWFFKIIKQLSITEGRCLTISKIKEDFETQFEDFELFWFSKNMTIVKNLGFIYQV